ncbi:MAG: hypothetical protein IKV35_06190 [Clostridia bacterium]|nr:hypothetical protein [Clostridia bacterium]
MSNKAQDRAKKPRASKMRKAYIVRLICRAVIFVACIVLAVLKPTAFDIVSGGFFTRFSLFHILWVVWMIDMIQQLIPIKKHIPLGSQKLFRERFKPVRETPSYQALRNHVITTTKRAYKIFLVWAAAIAVIGVLYRLHVLSSTHLFLITVAFYVCDLICVLVWCPFRLFLKNRCCTTCRIFNWDHLMMFTPMLFINSFYSASLLAMAFAVWVLWELCVMMYPERFWERSNEALQCARCTDKLCSQYCPKPKRK